jgi:saccharopine dehydrogenase (NAD+, L-glutamate forming)
MEDYGTFEGYANRNSLMYREVYGLHDIPTIYRGTLRRKGFSRAWDVFVQLGATDDSYVLEGSEDMSNRQFINSFLPYNENDSIELKLRHYMKIDLDDSLWDKLVWLGIFDDDKKMGLKNATPAQMLQAILEEKWKLEPDDKDMIAMYHKFVYKMGDEFREITSEMVNIGEDQVYTAMSNTVGLPLGICVKEVLNGKISLKGVHIPIAKEVYNPILDELEEYGIQFKEKQINPPRLYTEEETWS